MSNGSGAAAYDRLREAIVRVELPPGSPMSEAQLVERFGFTKSRARTELQAVLAAIADGDGARARELMAAAIGVFRDELVERLQRATLDRPI